MVRIRLSRMGAKKRPFYRIVVADSKRARGGRSREVIGTYDPLTEPATIHIFEDRALHWLAVGAQPTDTAKYLLEKVGVWAEFMKSKGLPYEPKPAEPAPSAGSEAPVETEPESTEAPASEEVLTVATESEDVEAPSAEEETVPES